MTPQACVAYVTMKSMEGWENLLKLFKASRLKRLCQRSIFERWSIAGKWMKAKVPVDPSLILWENLGVGKI